MAPKTLTVFRLDNYSSYPIQISTVAFFHFFHWVQILMDENGWNKTKRGSLRQAIVNQNWVGFVSKHILPNWEQNHFQYINYFELFIKSTINIWRLAITRIIPVRLM